MTSSALVIIGFIWTAIYQIDERYTPRSETLLYRTEAAVAVQDLKDLFKQGERRGLESERRALERELFDLRSAAERRSLTPLELSRKRIVEGEIFRITDEIEKLK